ncbi:MAG: DUF222 domain-containing protein [Candidatus Binatia bacterium]
MYSSRRLPAEYRDVGFLIAARLQEKRLRLVAALDPRREAAVFVDGCLRRLALQENRCRRALGQLLGVFRKRQAFVDLGFVRLGDWSRERLGISGSEAESMAKVVRGLERLPLVARSFDAGEISWTKARILVEAAGEETEERWLDVARDATVRELQKMIEEDRDDADDTRDEDGEPPMLASPAGARAELGAIREDDGEEIDGEPRVRFRMSCSGAVWLLFRRAVELARRMSGAEIPVW